MCGFEEITRSSDPIEVRPWLPSYVNITAPPPIEDRSAEQQIVVGGIPRKQSGKEIKLIYNLEKSGNNKSCLFQLPESLSYLSCMHAHVHVFLYYMHDYLMLSYSVLCGHVNQQISTMYEDNVTFHFCPTS